MRTVYKLCATHVRFAISHGIIFGALTALVVVIVAISPIFKPILSASAQTSFDARGFWWSDTFGWISLNCLNDWNGDGEPLEDRCAPGQYGVDFVWEGLVGTIRGTAWSPNLGIICFDSVTPGCEGLRDPVSGNPLRIAYSFREGETIMLTEGEETFEVAPVRGWGRIQGLQNRTDPSQGGWIQFDGRIRGRSLEDRANGGGGVRLRPTGFVEVGERRQRTFELVLAGSAWQQNEDRSGAGWIYLGEAPPGRPSEDNEIDGGQSTDPIPEGVTPPAVEREDECTDGDALFCCLNRQDDDGDESYTGLPDRNGATGVDCQDYDCAGVSFYSATTYNPEGGDPSSHCGPIPLINGRPANQENLLNSDDCFDGVDNDLDRTLDCVDSDCAEAENSDGQRTCRAEYIVAERDFCLDGIDNDGDGVSDCEDAECRGRAGLCDAGNFLTGHDQCAAGGLIGECAEVCPRGTHDRDRDLICSAIDNCSDVENPTQVDSNGNGRGDACDAFLETKEGSIYAPRLRVSQPPPRRDTATYCILTTGAQRFVPFNATSERCDLPKDAAVSELRLRQYADTIALLPSMTQETLRSRIDIAGLKRGIYGRVFQARNAREVISALRDRNPLAPKVIAYSGDLELTGDIVIPATRGGVTVLVDGNLLFGAASRPARVVYESGGNTDTRRIPSVAWVALDPNLDDDLIEGNIRVDSSVNELVGALFAADTIATGGGDLQLRVHGLMVARRFRFERGYVPDLTAPISVPQGAEVVIYDGRVALNPPPGLVDFVKTLPTSNVVPR